MNLRPALMVVAAIATTIAAPAVAQERKSELQGLVFELCPKILDGTVSLGDPAQVSGLGFVQTEPRKTQGGDLPRAEKGSGDDKVVLSSAPGMCSLWFGGPDNPSLAGSIVERALAEKLSGSTYPQRLGDGTLVFVFRDKSAKRLLTIILGDAGGELGIVPATTVIVMSEKDQ